MLSHKFVGTIDKHIYYSRNIVSESKLNRNISDALVC